MKKGNWGPARLFIIAVCIVLICGSGPLGSAQILPAAPEARVDLIRIDTLALFGKLEKPPVEFLHDAHTQALAKKNRDCTTCHLSDNDRFSPKFKRVKDTEKITVMNLYHQACISCHGEMRVAREKAGPVECDDCHREEARFSPARQPMGFDRSLHFRHVQAQKNDCGRCHHEYNEAEKKLFYAKGKEGTCRYCHRPETKDNITSIRLASHTGCIDCHSKSAAKKIESGPLTCLGCHDPAAQGKIRKISPVPRMERKQPDNVLLRSIRSRDEAEVEKQASMSFVPFDHKEHEEYNNTCRVCHHESLQACTTCHTIAGAKEGKGVRLETAMHQTVSQRSCRGCHLERQKAKQCAGCHGFMNGRLENPSSSCRPCHMQPPAQMPKTMNPDMEKALAAQMLEARTPVAVTYRLEDIPEIVTIAALSKKYAAVDLPHRKIINTLVNQTKESKLAAYFHTDPGNLCQGCHHNSPVAQKPPRCANCHGQPLDGENSLKPGIMGAYHLQCMSCHKQMGIEKPAGCTDCHKER